MSDIKQALNAIEVQYRNSIALNNRIIDGLIAGLVFGLKDVDLHQGMYVEDGFGELLPHYSRNLSDAEKVLEWIADNIPLLSPSYTPTSFSLDKVTGGWRVGYVYSVPDHGGITKLKMYAVHESAAMAICMAALTLLAEKGIKQ